MNIREELGVVIRTLEREVAYWKNAYEEEQGRRAIAMNDLKNTSRDYSELRESYDKLFDEHQELKAALNPELRTSLQNYNCMHCGKWYATTEVRDHHEEHCAEVEHYETDYSDYRDPDGANGGNRRQEP